jgi:hypothetical protein
MKRTNEEKLTKFWNNRINPVTGWFDEKRILKKANSNKRVLTYESNI